MEIIFICQALSVVYMLKKKGGTFNGFCKSSVIRHNCGKNEIIQLETVATMV